MPTPFLRTLRSIQADVSRLWIVSATAAGLLLLSWGIWFALAPFKLRVWSDSARVEARAEPHVLHAPVEERVAAVYVRLDDEVRAGTLLIEFDAEQEKIQLDQQESSLRFLKQELAALAERMQAEQAGLETAGALVAAAIREGESIALEREAAARIAESVAARSSDLFEEGHIGELEEESAALIAVQRRAEVESARSSATGRALAERVSLSDRVARIGEIRRDIAVLEGRITHATLEVSRLRKLIADREIRAPIGGRIGSLEGLRPGAVLEIGDVIGTIVPDGGLGVVAAFRPGRSLGLLKPGKIGEMRFEAFPWTRHGVLPVVVRNVGLEVQQGLVRVELDIPENHGSAIPLQHGLTGAVSIEVDELSPAMLVLRYSGKLGQRPGASSAN